MSIYTTLVPMEAIQESKRCNKIVNRRSGAEFLRNLDPVNKWEVLYHRAICNKDEFDCFYDSETAAEGEVKGKVTYTKADLETKSMPHLRKIGEQFEVTGVSKAEIIERILKAQG